MDLEKYIAVVPDFPKKGISYKDITTLIQNGPAYHESIKQLEEFVKECGAEVIVSPESRGFIFGCPVAADLSLSFIPIRKKGKLPRKTISVKYDLEYGTDELFMHADAIKPGQKVVIIDDIVAIGGTLNAVAKLVEECGGEVVGMGCVMALYNLPGMDLLKKKYNFKALMLQEG